MLFKKKYNFFVECDIKYPKKLHDLHNDYQIAPEILVIENNFEEFDYCRNLKNKLNLKNLVHKLKKDILFMQN